MNLRDVGGLGLEQAGEDEFAGSRVVNLEEAGKSLLSSPNFVFEIGGGRRGRLCTRSKTQTINRCFYLLAITSHIRYNLPA